MALGYDADMHESMERGEYVTRREYAAWKICSR